jgi:hypothetical protein
MKILYHTNMKALWAFVFVLFQISVSSQVKNLLRNPSLDSVNTCDYFTSILQPIYWNQNPFNDAIGFNMCSNSPMNSQWMPKNQDGFQYAKDGSGYGGISLLGNSWGASTRLYLQSKLYRKLRSKRYNIYIYISATIALWPQAEFK